MQTAGGRLRCYGRPYRMRPKDQAAQVAILDHGRKRGGDLKQSCMTMYDFLLVRQCNYSSILYRLRVI